MQIDISSGIGVGPTKLSAFDAALNDAGVANYNLLILSSVIPPSSTIKVLRGTEKQALPGKWGDRLYVVKAEMRVEEPNVEAWAGIGWVQDRSSGKGLFVEHEGHSENTVRHDIAASLKALMETRGINFGDINMHVVGTTCVSKPVCALVVATYQISDWHNTAVLLGGGDER